MAGGPNGASKAEKLAATSIAVVGLFVTIAGPILAASYSVVSRAAIIEEKLRAHDATFGAIKSDVSAVQEQQRKLGDSVQRIDERTEWMRRWMERRDR